MYNNQGSYGRGAGSRRPYDSGGGRGGGGYSDRGRRPGFQGRGNQRFDNAPRPTESKVSTNHFPLQVKSRSFDPPDKFDFVRYKVVIKGLKWAKEIDPETKEEKTDPKNGKVIKTLKVIRDGDDDERYKKRFFNGPYPWRVMKQIVKDHGLLMEYDGAELVVAPQYATEHIRSAGKITEDGDITFQVRIKRDCEEDDLEADKMKSSWYAVTLSKTSVVPFADLIDALNGVQSSTEELSMIVNLILKSTALLSGMICLDQRSSTKCFPLDVQRELSNGRPIEASNGTRQLLAGISENTVFPKAGGSGGAGAFVITDPKAEFADKEQFRDSRYFDESNTIKLLITDGRYPTIAGVRINNTNRPITDPHTRDEIEKKLSKTRFHLRYTITKPDEKREKDLLGKGKSREWIEESRKRVLKNQSLYRHRETGVKILWSAKDFSFDWDGTMITVFDYYREKYGIRLKFPEMPIVYVGRDGWFPIEFACQAFAKTKDANDPDMINAVLGYYDQRAGTDFMRDVVRKRNLLSRFSEERLGGYNLIVDHTPTCLTAKVLPSPVIKFEQSEARVKDGSFNLHNMRFSRPATLNSFVVADFTNNKRSCEEFVGTLLKVADRHGIQIPASTMDIGRRYLDAVTEHCRGGRGHIEDDALEVVRKSIEKAKDVYIRDSTRVFRDNHVWFKTYCYNESKNEIECAILPPRENGDGRVGLLLDYSDADASNIDSDANFFSHRIKTHNGDEYKARLMVKIRQTDRLIDPLDFRFDNGTHQALKRSGDNECTWQNVTFNGYCYLANDGRTSENIEVESNDVNPEESVFLHFLDDWEVDCPSLIIAYLPSDGNDKRCPKAAKGLYDRIKYLTNQCGGVQSQCVVMEKFQNQKNKDQYTSNIATKINAKLSTPHNKAISWHSSIDGNKGNDEIPWVGERPTLVVGIGMSHGLGNAMETVVAASVCLDKGCMRLSQSCFVQGKSDVVSKGVMEDIIKVSWDHYTSENKCEPERILIYRDGISDGNFPSARDEIASIRKAVFDKRGNECPNCSAGCVLCCPPITFVVCQSQHNIRMVPFEEREGFGQRNGKNNVHSGTALDHTVMEFGTMLRIGDDDFELIKKRYADGGRGVIFGQLKSQGSNFHIESFDHLLTAQGGMKGTSKPIYYRVLLNENAFWGPHDGTGEVTPLTKENLELCTYHMSLKYPTATKATREIPAVKYAKRVANQVLSGLKYLREGSTWFDMTFVLEYPEDTDYDDSERRPYMKMTNNKDGTSSKNFNLVEFAFRNHLAA